MSCLLCDLLTFHSVCIGVRGVKCHVYLVTSWYFIVQYICISVHGGQMSCYFVTSGRSIVIALVFTKVKYVYLATTMPFSVCSSIHEGEMSCVRGDLL